MLARLSILAGGAPIQRLLAPGIYLDHWALRDASAGADLTQRFSDALERLGGTLVLSWVNIAEFCKVRTDEEAKRAELFIERNLPRLFVLAPDPFAVRDRHDGRPAPEDDGLLQALAALKPDAGREFAARGLLTEMRGQLLETMDRWKRIFVQRVEVLREEYLANSQLADRVDQIPDDPGTRLILKELLRDYMAVLKRPVDANDAPDFFHTVVPVVFCDWCCWTARASHS